MAHDEYWCDGKDCTQQTKIKPEVKLMAALKVISFGVLFGTFCDYFQMGKSTVHHAVSKFARGVFQIDEITEKYLRKLMKSDAKKVFELHNNQHGMSGMIGCLDWMHVPWENCPNYLHGQHVGKEGVPTLVVEASCYYNYFFGIMILGMPAH